MGCLKLDILEENYSPLKVVRDDLKTTVKPCTGVYLYGFNGMEKEDDIYGSANAYTAEFWMYDARLGRWLTQDPIVHPWSSPFAAFNNNPIYFSDPSGLSPGNGDEKPETPQTGTQYSGGDKLPDPKSHDLTPGDTYVHSTDGVTYTYTWNGDKWVNSGGSASLSEVSVSANKSTKSNTTAKDNTRVEPIDVNSSVKRYRSISFTYELRSGELTAGAGGQKYHGTITFDEDQNILGAGVPIEIDGIATTYGEPSVSGTIEVGTGLLWIEDSEDIWQDPIKYIKDMSSETGTVSLQIPFGFLNTGGTYTEGSTGDGAAQIMQTGVIFSIGVSVNPAPMSASYSTSDGNTATRRALSFSDSLKFAKMNRGDSTSKAVITRSFGQFRSK